MINWDCPIPVGVIAWDTQKQWYDIYICPKDTLIIDGYWHTYAGLVVESIRHWIKDGLPGYNFGLGRQVVSKPYETLYWVNVRALLNHSIELDDSFKESEEFLTAEELFDKLNFKVNI